MFVDDEPFNLLALRYVMDSVGIYNHDEICDEAKNGQEALDIIVKDVQKNNGQYCSFDLILMDF